jgi:hypothetical protein
MSAELTMRLDTSEHKRVTAREPVRVRPRPAARPPRRRPNRRLVVALTFVVLAGFLLGLGLPIHL